VWACLKGSHALLDAIQSLEGLLSIRADVAMEHLELSGDMLDGGGEPDHGVTRFIVALAEAHRAHRSHADGCPSNSSDQLDHAPRLAPLPAARFLATSPWSAVLAVADAGGFWWSGLVVNPGGASFGFDGHQESAGCSGSSATGCGA
jgi:hypothetical protein